MRHDKHPPEPREIEVPEFTETPAFRKYVSEITALMKRSKRGVCTSDIHAKLGTERRAWTLTAIQYIADVQESWTINPVRYSIERKRVSRNAYGSIPAVR